MSECDRCNATDETQPLEGIGDDGLCLVCRNKQEEERPIRISERLRAKLSDDTEQASIGVFA